MTDWLTYARKNEAFTQKWKGKVKRALNDQLQRYAESYKRGNPDLNIFTDNGQLISALLDIYGDCGGYFARTTYNGLKREARVSVRSNGGSGNNMAKAYGYHKAEQGHRKGVSEISDIQLKRGSLGFSIDWANKIIDRLRISAINLAQKISNYTRQKVLSILEEAQTENLTLDETIARIVSEVGDMNASRAETITRTEVGRAAGEGKMIGAKQLGVKLNKKWVSAVDHRTRRNPKRDPKQGDHVLLNGQVRPMEEHFSNGIHQLMQPGDSNAPASEVVNCRCSVTFEVVKDANGQPIPATYFDKPITGYIPGSETLLQVVNEGVIT